MFRKLISFEIWEQKPQPLYNHKLCNKILHKLVPTLFTLTSSMITELLIIKKIDIRNFVGKSLYLG